MSLPNTKIHQYRKVRRKAFVLSALLIAGVLTLAFLVGTRWGADAMWVSVGYPILVTFFLVAQVWGFIISQVKYSESVEATKFEPLKAEGIEWERS